MTFSALSGLCYLATLFFYHHPHSRTQLARLVKQTCRVACGLAELQAAVQLLMAMSLL